MNTPTNMKKFSLELAQLGHPLCTRDGCVAKFIAYVPDVIIHHQLVVQVNDEVVRYNPQGCIGSGNIHWDLFLAPLGYVEGKPVFAGDKLLNDWGKEFEITLNVHLNSEYVWNTFKWPSKAPVVETRMSWDNLHDAYLGDSNKLEAWNSEYCRNLANKAIERSIADGDVIPTSLFVEMACDAYNKRTESFSKSFDEIAKEVLKDYLEGLK